MTGNHTAKPSYFGDQLIYEFPSPKEEVDDDGSPRGVTPKIIERAGSIFIKSGIPKVTPFPRFEYEDDDIDLVESTTTVDQNTVGGNTWDNDRITVDNSDPAKREKVYSCIEHDPNNHNLASLTPENSLGSSLLSDIGVNDAQVYEDDVVDILTEDNANSQVFYTNKEEEPSSIRQFDDANPEAIPTLHKEVSLSKTSKEEELLRSRPSLRQVDSTKRRKFVNPYLKNSLIRKYKNIHKEEISVQETDTSDDSSGTGINLEELEIPRRSSKRIQRMSNSVRRALLPALQSLEESRNYSRNSSVGRSRVSRLSSSRTLKTLGNSIRKKNNEQLSRKTSKLNGDSIKTIKTLATEIRRSTHDKNRSSVDFEKLDQLLQELINIQSEESLVSSRRPTTSSVSKSTSHSHSTISETKYTHGEEPIEFPGVQPYSAKEVSRQNSLRRSLSTLSTKLERLNNTYSTKVPPTCVSKKPSTLMGERKRSSTGNPNSHCELKRSNAVKRKYGFITPLVLFLKSIGHASKKSWRFIRASGKKVLFRGRNQEKSVYARSNKNKSLTKPKIGKPVVVDIHQTPFKTHNLNREVVPERKFLPIPQNTTVIDDCNVGDVGDVGEGEYDFGDDFDDVVDQVASDLEVIPSNDTGKEEPLEGDGEKLVGVWKHYLSESIVNRVNLKVDLSKAEQLERVESVQSKRSRITSIEDYKRREFDNLVYKYIGGGSSTSLSVSTASNGSSTGYYASANESVNDESIRNSISKSSLSTWSTISTGYTGSATDEHSYTGSSEEDDISTIEEENDTDISSIEDVYDTYSLVSHAAGQPESDEITKSVSTRSGISDSSSRRSSLKHSRGMTNLKSILHRENTMKSSTMGRKLSKRVFSGVSETSDVFSYTASVGAC